MNSHRTTSAVTESTNLVALGRAACGVGGTCIARVHATHTFQNYHNFTFLPLLLTLQTLLLNYKL